MAGMGGEFVLQFCLTKGVVARLLAITMVLLLPWFGERDAGADEQDSMLRGHTHIHTHTYTQR